MAQTERSHQLSRQKKIFCMKLQNGLAIWSGLESIFWFGLFCIALKLGSIYATSGDLLDFMDATDNNWYFRMIFGEVYYVDQKTRMRFLLVHYVLVQVFAIYSVVNVFLLIAIIKVNRRFFTPYFWFDAAIVCLVASLLISGAILKFTSNFPYRVNHLFVCFSIFILIKLYVRRGLMALKKNYKIVGKTGNTDFSNVELNVV